MMRLLIGCMEILFLKLAATIIGLDLQPFLRTPYQLHWADSREAFAKWAQVFSNLFSSRKLKIFQCENLIFAIWVHLGATLVRRIMLYWRPSRILTWLPMWVNPSAAPLLPIEHTWVVPVLGFPFFFSFHTWQVLVLGTLLKLSYVWYWH